VSTRLGDFILTKRSAKPTTKQKRKNALWWNFVVFTQDPQPEVHQGFRTAFTPHTNRFHTTQIRVNAGMLQVRESHSVCSTT
jgi:hypothetical protein